MWPLIDPPYLPDEDPADLEPGLDPASDEATEAAVARFEAREVADGMRVRREY